MSLVRISKIASLAAGAFLLAACTGYDTEAPVVDDGYNEPAGPVAGTQEDLEANVGNRIFFDFDRYDLDETDKDILRRQAAWLKQHPSVKLLIAGNCDERGTREYNLALGARRANSAKDFLIGLGIDGSRLSTVSYGKERPECGASTESCWAINRNDTMTVVGGPSS